MTEEKKGKEKRSQEKEKKSELKRRKETSSYFLGLAIKIDPLICSGMPGGSQGSEAVVSTFTKNSTVGDF